MLEPTPSLSDFAYTPQRTSTQGLVVPIKWYLRYLRGRLGGAGGYRFSRTPPRPGPGVRVSQAAFQQAFRQLRK